MAWEADQTSFAYERCLSLTATRRVRGTACDRRRPRSGRKKHLWAERQSVSKLPPASNNIRMRCSRIDRSKAYSEVSKREGEVRKHYNVCCAEAQRGRGEVVANSRITTQKWLHSDQIHSTSEIIRQSCATTCSWLTLRISPGT